MGFCDSTGGAAAGGFDPTNPATQNAVGQQAIKDTTSGPTFLDYLGKMGEANRNAPTSVAGGGSGTGMNWAGITPSNNGKLSF